MLRFAQHDTFEGTNRTYFSTATLVLTGKAYPCGAIQIRLCLDRQNSTRNWQDSYRPEESAAELI